MPNRVKIYVTKWAVAGGIQIYEGWPNGDNVKWRMNGWDHYAHKGEWFLNEEDARKDAQRRIDRKLASLRKQIAKLEKGPINITDNIVTEGAHVDVD